MWFKSERQRRGYVSTTCCNYVLYNWMLTLAVLLQRTTARIWKLTQLARSYVWYGRNERRRGRRQKGRDREWRKEQRERQGDREAQQLLIQTNLMLSAVVHSRRSTLLHTELQCHSLPLAAHMKWQQALALSQQATAATGVFKLLLVSRAGQGNTLFPALHLHHYNTHC